MMTGPNDIVRLPREAWPPIGELPPDMRLIAETIGMENLMKLYEAVGSTNIYFGGYGKYLRKHRDVMIRKLFDRRTVSRSARAVVAELARENELSDRQIWTILGRPDERQLRLPG